MTFEEFVKKNGYEVPKHILSTYKEIEILLNEGKDVFVIMPRHSCRTMFMTYLKKTEKILNDYKELKND